MQPIAAGVTPLQIVRGEELDVGQQPIGAELWRGNDLGREQRDDGEGSEAETHCRIVSDPRADPMPGPEDPAYEVRPAYRSAREEGVEPDALATAQ